MRKVINANIKVIFVLVTLCLAYWCISPALSYPQSSNQQTQYSKKTIRNTRTRTTKQRYKARRNKKQVKRKQKRKTIRKAKSAPVAKPKKKLSKLDILLRGHRKKMRSKDMPVTGEAVDGMQDFEKKFIRMLHKWHIPGATVAIMENDRLAYARGFGWADIEKKKAVQPNSVFRIASVSKAITAVTILKLVDMGKLSLDDKVFKILDDIKPIAGKKKNPKLNRISVRNLLHMSSGLLRPGRGHFDPMFGPWSLGMKKKLSPIKFPASCKNTMRMMLSYPLRYPPGKGYAYSNLDYCLLGLVINKVTGTPYGHQGYENFVNKNILNPLEIKDMSIASTLVKDCKPNEVKYYYYIGPINPDNYSRSSYLPYSTDQVLQKNFANGGWVASATDLVKFVHDVSYQKVLPKKLFDTMLAPPTYAKSSAKRYSGMGWRVRHQKEAKYWVQTGSFTGTNSFVMHRPNGIVIAVIFNSRPPSWHLFRNFRPNLKKLLHSKHTSKLLVENN